MSDPEIEQVTYPKWVKPHDNHIARQGEHLSTPAFDNCHVDRDGSVTVLVANSDEEDKALADPKVLAEAETAETETSVEEKTTTEEGIFHE